MSDSLDESREAFRRLFPSARDAEQQFAELFRRLVTFFRLKNWKEPNERPEDLAQETVARGLKRISEGVDIYTDPMHYFWGVASFVASEDRRAAHQARHHEMVPLDDLELPGSDYARRTEAGVLVREFLSWLSPDDRAVFIEYYLGDRVELRRKLRTTKGALRVRVFRIRRHLDGLIAGRKSGDA